MSSDSRSGRRRSRSRSPSRIKKESSHDNSSKYRSNRRTHDGSRVKTEEYEDGRQSKRHDKRVKTEESLSAGGDTVDQPKDVEKPNFKQSGKLAKETNSVNGTVLKYNEPEDACAPKREYKLFIFEKDNIIEKVSLSGKSCYLLGRDRRVSDLILEGNSISKQHAAIQFRQLKTTDKYGDVHYKIKPYIIDLESSYGTVLNGDKVPISRYVELRSEDVLKFAETKREYVFIEA